MKNKLSTKIWDFMNGRGFIFLLKITVLWLGWRYLVKDVFPDIWDFAGALALFGLFDLQYDKIVLEDRVGKLEWVVNKPTRDKKEAREESKKLVLPHDLS